MIKKLKYLIVLLLFCIVNTAHADFKQTKFVWNVDETTSWKADILEKNPLAWDIISKFKYLWKWYVVRSIPDWQLKIYKELNIWTGSMFKMRTLNTLECGDNYWFCFNGADAGPFQINQIHKDDFKWSKYLVIQGRNAIAWWDIKSAEAIRYTLFKFQAKWVAKRMSSMDKQFCHRFKTDDLKMKCQAQKHNGNTKNWFYIRYSERAVESYKLLKQYYY
jgi:hypothetical protein